MKKSYSTGTVIGALALATLTGAAMGVAFLLNRGSREQREIVKDTKNLAKNLKKKAQKKARNIRKEDWLDQEKEKIMNQSK